MLAEKTRTTSETKPAKCWRNKWRGIGTWSMSLRRTLPKGEEYFDGHAHPSFEVAEQRALDWLAQNPRWTAYGGAYLGAFPVE